MNNGELHERCPWNRALALAYLAYALGAADTNGGEGVKKNTKGVSARVVDVDAPTKTLVVMVRGEGREVFTVPDDAKVIDADGSADRPSAY
jgi:hypothetical protein